MRLVLALSAAALFALPAEARPKGQPKQECHWSTSCIVLDGKKICSKVRICNPGRSVLS